MCRPLGTEVTRCLHTARRSVPTTLSAGGTAERAYCMGRALLDKMHYGSAQAVPVTNAA